MLFRSPDQPGNIRDQATIEQLVVLSNLESINAMLIDQGFLQGERLQQLNETGRNQMTSLVNIKTIKNMLK